MSTPTIRTEDVSGERHTDDSPCDASELVGLLQEMRQTVASMAQSTDAMEAAMAAHMAAEEEA